MNHYAQVSATGVTLWGPGALPHFINDKDGNPIDLHKMTDAAKEQLGIYKVREIGKADYDERFQTQERQYGVEDGWPVYRYSYPFRDGARAMMARAVDELAGIERDKFLTLTPGQDEEYKAAAEEAAKALREMELGSVPRADDYPFLSADIGITINPGTGLPVASIEEAAAVVQGVRDVAFAEMAVIRRRRKEGKRDVLAAGGDAEALAVLQALDMTVAEIFMVSDPTPQPLADAAKFNPNLKPLPEGVE